MDNAYKLPWNNYSLGTSVILKRDGTDTEELGYNHHEQEQDTTIHPIHHEVEQDTTLDHEQEQDTTLDHEQEQNTTIQDISENRTAKGRYELFVRKKKGLNFSLVIPSVQWDGYGWRQGPQHLTYKKDILPNLQAGDRLEIQKKLKRKSTRKNLILKRRSHTKDLFASMEKILKSHFSENVFFSEKNKIQIDMENMGWNENLNIMDLGCEEAEYTGNIKFTISFIIKIE